MRQQITAAFALLSGNEWVVDDVGKLVHRALSCYGYRAGVLRVRPPLRPERRIRSGQRRPRAAAVAGAGTASIPILLIGAPATAASAS